MVISLLAQNTKSQTQYYMAGFQVELGGHRTTFKIILEFRSQSHRVIAKQVMLISFSNNSRVLFLVFPVSASFP